MQMPTTNYAGTAWHVSHEDGGWRSVVEPFEASLHFFRNSDVGSTLFDVPLANQGGRAWQDPSFRSSGELTRIPGLGNSQQNGPELVGRGVMGA